MTLETTLERPTVADATSSEHAASPMPKLRRRVGGLPLPGTTASLDAGLPSHATASRFIARDQRWNCRFAAPDAAADHEARRDEPRPRKRVGGLPLPDPQNPHSLTAGA